MKDFSTMIATHKVMKQAKYMSIKPTINSISHKRMPEQVRPGQSFVWIFSEETLKKTLQKQQK